MEVKVGPAAAIVSSGAKISSRKNGRASGKTINRRADRPRPRAPIRIRSSCVANLPRSFVGSLRLSVQRDLYQTREFSTTRVVTRRAGTGRKRAFGSPGNLSQQSQLRRKRQRFGKRS